MAPRKNTVQPRTTNEAPQVLLSFDDDMDIENSGVNEEITTKSPEDSDEQEYSNEQEFSSVDSSEGKTRLRSSVWNYATKISTGKAQCKKCKKFVKTLNGGTSTL